jgi:diaminopimelate decarboxylase/aspartate kinase
MNSYVVLKFGGTSVSSLENWQNIKKAAEETISKGEKPLLVCSAVSQVSNKLEAIIELAKSGKHEDKLSELKKVHNSLVNELGIKEDTYEKEFEDLTRLVTAIALIGEESPQLRARIMAKGELMSTSIGSAYLNSVGLKSSWLDARSILQRMQGQSYKAKRAVELLFLKHTFLRFATMSITMKVYQL